jgi:hypothetical protein
MHMLGMGVPKFLGHRNSLHDQFVKLELVTKMA